MPETSIIFTSFYTNYGRNISIDENSKVAVVTQDVPDNVVVGGIPEKIIRKLQY